MKSKWEEGYRERTRRRKRSIRRTNVKMRRKIKTKRVR